MKEGRRKGVLFASVRMPATLPLMLIDDVTIHVTAGAGGSGVASFGDGKSHRGPNGGNGGQGGNVILEAVADLGALHKYRAQKQFKAEPGKDGRSDFRDGRAGEDLVLPVPRGTVVHIEGKEPQELINTGDRLQVVRGGRGGKGNFLYRSSTNVAPRQFQAGKPGFEADLRLELRLIADVGFVGFPNVGKSSLLNAVTRANSRVANYAFTTLEPHLGVFHDLVLADIPGIIEGASEGKGLGTKFLRHIVRTRAILHCVQATSDDVVADYKAIRAELKGYSEELAAKPERVLLTKSDEVDAKTLEKKRKLLEKAAGSPVISTSIIDDASLKELDKLLSAIAEENAAANRLKEEARKAEERAKRDAEEELENEDSD